MTHKEKVVSVLPRFEVDHFAEERPDHGPTQERDLNRMRVGSYIRHFMEQDPYDGSLHEAEEIIQFLGVRESPTDPSDLAVILPKGVTHETTRYLCDLGVTPIRESTWARYGWMEPVEMIRPHI